MNTFNQIASDLSNTKNVTSGKMFGKQCLKNAKGKAFCAYFQDDMVFKLGKENLSALLSKYPGSTNWDPSGKGRPMKDWIQIPKDYKKEWMELAILALEFNEAHN